MKKNAPFQALFLACCLVFLCLVPPAFAELEIEITEGGQEAVPIAIIPFQWKAKNSSIQRGIIEKIVRNDLKSSGYFLPMKRSELVGLPSNINNVDFDRWKKKKVENIVMGRVVQLSNQRISVTIEMVDVLRRQTVIHKRWNNLRLSKIRRLGHRISDLVYERITGTPGIFSTKIVYVTGNTSSQKNRSFILEVSDADGHNPHPILKSTEPILSPAWSPDGKKIAYVSFERGRSEIIVQALSGNRYSLAHYKGINGAPAWSKNGRYVAMSLSKAGNSDIYVMDLKTRNLKQITTHYAIDTEPAWAPDGQSLYFTSDRRGSVHIFKADLNTLDITRITYEGRYNAGAAVSPNGSHLAFIHGRRGRYNVAYFNLATSDMQILTGTVLAESPSFSPNGRMILYSTVEKKDNILAVVAIDGSGVQKLRATRNNVQEPDWGPYVNTRN